MKFQLACIINDIKIIEALAGFVNNSHFSLRLGATPKVQVPSFDHLMAELPRP